jgi:flavin reductase (DIM6/NTAB) family NADH-FMN oxidoreductase RutF
MIIDPNKQDRRDIYKLMIGNILPRPIALVSTISSEGIYNLAPFSFFTGITSKPPTICFAPDRRPADGEKKDTLLNIEASGQFVVNVVTEAILVQMNEAATDYPREFDEFELSGLTAAPSSSVVPPRVKESPINMECKLNHIIEVGPRGSACAALVIGEIVMFHVADELIDNGRIDTSALNPIGRLAGSEYTTLGRRISLKRKKYKPAGGEI